MEKPERIKMSDGPHSESMIKRGSTIFKAKKRKGVEITYEEIDLEEYDKRIDDLAKKIAKQPEVDLLSILKDALYDLPLDTLAVVEKRISEELKKSKPKIITKVDRTYRGTCVKLNVDGRNLIELRH